MTTRSAPCSDDGVPRDARLRLVAAFAVLAIAAVPSPLHADGKAEAQVLFDQGMQLLKDGKTAEACAAFEASVEKYPGLGARGKLAECYEKLDKLARAWALYREVADAARRDGDTRREQVARKRADDLQPRVPKITIVVPPESKRDGMTITRDGKPISNAELGLPIFVDAGKHTVTASAPGLAPYTQDIDSVNGATVEVVIPALKSMLDATTDKPATPTSPGEKAGLEPGSKRAKDVAQGLVVEGVALHEKKDFQLALDRFIAAYELYPSPKLLLNMAGTLREMGRTSDAADTYQAFIEAPDTNPEFVGEAKAILNQLDEQLHILVLGTTPRGADVSLDGGPWISVGDKKMMVRLKPGIHMVRSRKQGFALEELTINAFEGEKNTVEMVLKVPAPDSLAATGTTGDLGNLEERDPVDPSAGKAIEAIGSSKDGQNVIPVLSIGARAERGGVLYQSTAVIRDDNDDIVEVITPSVDTGGSELGLTAQLRIDGAGGGAAAAFGISFAHRAFRNFELDLTGMVSKPVPPSGVMADAKRIYGVFLGVRYRLLTGMIRPTLGVGMPTFFSDGKPRIGVRGAGGLELKINRHLAIVGELGYEHFFNTQDGYKANVFVPLVQVTGRL
jgi:tetratricopeptide (TPR) repeat protein